MELALLKTFHKGGERLAPLRVSQYSDRGNNPYLPRSAGVQRPTHRPFETSEETFHHPAPSKPGLLQMLRGHLCAPFAADLAIGPASHRRDDAFHAPLFPTVLVNPFGIISRIGKQACRLRERLRLRQQL